MQYLALCMSMSKTEHLVHHLACLYLLQVCKNGYHTVTRKKRPELALSLSSLLKPGIPPGAKVFL